MKNEKNTQQLNIGVLIGNVYTDHPIELIRGIQAAALEYPVNLEFFLGTQSNSFYKELSDAKETEDYEYQFNTIYDFSDFGDLDALIISYGTLCIFLDEKNREEFFERFSLVPRVILEESKVDDVSSHIISDNYNGSFAAVEHLIVKHGCRNILYISGPKHNTDATQRRNGFLDAMKKYHLPVSEDQIIYGDYTQFIVQAVGEMLDKNPQAEAICAANDAMAFAAYEACKMRGKVIGKDIAIVGYDNSFLADSVDPPMTTVEQNGYDMGYFALLEAISLAQGGSPRQIIMPSKLEQRGSCGCHRNKGVLENVDLHKNQIMLHLPIIASRITSKVCVLTQSDYFKEAIILYVNLILEYIVERVCLSEEVVETRVHVDNITELLRSAFTSSFSFYMKEGILCDCICEFLLRLADNEADAARKMQYMQIMNSIQKYLVGWQNKKNFMDNMEVHKKNWLSPLLLRAMNEHGADARGVLLEAVKGLQKQNTKSSYLFLFDNPIEHIEGQKWEMPDHLYLAAWHDENSAYAPAPADRTRLTRDIGFSTLFRDGNHTYVAFSLFYETMQYGVILCEMIDYDIASIYTSTLQISTGLHVLLLKMKEQEMQRELYRTMKLLEDKNQVLQAVSMADPLTGLWNRRGIDELFHKNAMMHPGEKATLLLADLDHLKQINDSFGHAEGDYAINKLAELLKQCIGTDALVGRLGGDEFMAISFKPVDLEHIRTAFQNNNAISDKPYLIECSIGRVDFVCDKDTNLVELLRTADTALYEAKKARRESVIKNMQG